MRLRRAEWERQDGIPDRPANPDARTPIDLDLRCAGGPRVTLRPVRGKCAWVQFVDGKPQRRARIPPLHPPHSRGSESRGIRV